MALKHGTYTLSTSSHSVKHGTNTPNYVKHGTNTVWTYGGSTQDWHSVWSGSKYLVPDVTQYAPDDFPHADTWYISSSLLTGRNTRATGYDWTELADMGSGQVLDYSLDAFTAEELDYNAGEKLTSWGDNFMEHYLSRSNNNGYVIADWTMKISNWSETYATSRYFELTNVEQYY